MPNDDSSCSSSSKEKKQPYKCKQRSCGESYFSWNDLKQHLSSAHNLEKMTESDYLGVKEHSCMYPGCNAKFPRPWRLQAHMSQHSGDKLFTCGVKDCNKKYTKLSHLKRHIATIHEPHDEPVEFFCPEKGCSKVYRNQQNVNRHCKLYHSNKAKHLFKCNYCDESFRTKNDLCRHEYVHTKNPAWRCVKCCIAFTDITLWKKHRRAIHKKYLCNEPGCYKKFSNFKTYRKHKSKHSSNLICPTCNKMFCRKSNLKVHEQTHLPSGERTQFICPFSECSRFYTKKSNLEQHIQIAHKGKRFTCGFPSCLKDFVTKQKLIEHIHKHTVLSPTKVKKQTVRNKRKDAGLPKRSMAVKLSGINVPYDVEKKVLKRETVSRKKYCQTSEDEWDASMDYLLKPGLQQLESSLCISKMEGLGFYATKLSESAATPSFLPDIIDPETTNTCRIVNKLPCN